MWALKRSAYAPRARAIEQGTLDLVEDRHEPAFVLPDLGQRFVQCAGEFHVAGLHLAHLRHALAQRIQLAAPALTQRLHLYGVVEVDDDVLLGAAQVPQAGAKFGHVGERLHLPRKQLLQRGARAVERNVAQSAHCSQQDQGKSRGEIQPRANGKLPQNPHGIPLLNMMTGMCKFHAMAEIPPGGRIGMQLYVASAGFRRRVITVPLSLVRRCS